MIIGGLDIGTTGCKIVLYDENAQLLDTYYTEYNTAHKDGQHEIDFKDLRNGVMKLLKVAAGKYKIDALGVTSFGETFAMLDENDNILSPSMLYTDPRGNTECKELCEKIGEERLTLLTGAKPHPMYSISKILWQKNNNPVVFSKCKRILLGEDFIVYTLTGVANIDYSLAARTGAFDIEKRCWISEVFEKSGIDVKLMSKPVESGTLAGEITDKVRSELDIDYDIKVVNGYHDQVAAMMGAGVFDYHQAMDGTGTVECIPVILEEKPKDMSFYDKGYSLVPFDNERYACYALSYTGGATLKWFRDNFAELENLRARENGENVYELLDNSVKDKPTGILILPHFAGAATPYMDIDSKAAMVGITLETDKYDIYKALMEGTAYEMLLNLDAMGDSTADITEIRATGGGATSDLWLQIKADILGREITALNCKEVGAAGTVAITGAAIGAFENIRATVAKMVPIRKVFAPDNEMKNLYSSFYKKYKKLYNQVKELR
ncbi:MAG: carbohydrate kinase [Clostridia bacterium]|nr:carbohydrate kinase [Clostridia bacterium]